MIATINAHFDVDQSCWLVGCLFFGGDVRDIKSRWFDPEQVIPFESPIHSVQFSSSRSFVDPNPSYKIRSRFILAAGSNSSAPNAV